MQSTQTKTRNPLPWLFLIPLFLVLATIVLFAQGFDDPPNTVTITASDVQPQAAVPATTTDGTTPDVPVEQVVYTSSDEGFSVQAARLLVVLTAGCVLAITFSLLFARVQEISTREAVRRHRAYSRAYERVRREQQWHSGNLMKQPIPIERSQPAFHQRKSPTEPTNIIKFK